MGEGTLNPSIRNALEAGIVCGVTTSCWLLNVSCLESGITSNTLLGFFKFNAIAFDFSTTII